MAGIYRRGATTTDEIIDFVAGTELGSDQIYIGYMGSDLLWGKVVFVDVDPARRASGAEWDFGYTGSPGSLRQEDALKIDINDVATGVSFAATGSLSSLFGLSATETVPVAGADYTMTVNVGDVVNSVAGGVLHGWIGGEAAYTAGFTQSSMTPLFANATNVVSGTLGAGETVAYMVLTMAVDFGDSFILETSSIQAGDWFNYYTPGVIVYANEPAQHSGTGWDISYAGPYEDSNSWRNARAQDLVQLSIVDEADGTVISSSGTVDGPYGLANSLGLTLIPAVAQGETYTATVDIGDVVAAGGGVLKGALVGTDGVAPAYDITGTTLTANATNQITGIPNAPYMYLMVWLTEFSGGTTVYTGADPMTASDIWSKYPSGDTSAEVTEVAAGLRWNSISSGGGNGLTTTLTDISVTPGTAYTVTVDVSDYSADFIGDGKLWMSISETDGSTIGATLSNTSINTDGVSNVVVTPTSTNLRVLVYFTTSSTTAEFTLNTASVKSLGDSLKVESLRVEMGDLT